MTTSWFYMDKGVAIGPLDQAALADLAGAGRISGATSIRGAEEEAWSRLDVRLPQIAALSPASTPAPPDAPAGSRWTDTMAHPWRRFFARLLDTVVGGVAILFIVAVLVALVDPASAQALAGALTGPGGQILSSVLTVALAIPGNILFIGLTGSTPGKWLFGVRVLRPDGRPIGLGDALTRELDVWVRGRGLGIPIVTLITAWVSYSALQRDKFAPWDPPAVRVVVHRAESVVQTLLALAGVVLLVGLSVGLTLLS